MNVYDAIVKDYPYSSFKFASAITSQPDAMGGAAAASQRTRVNATTNPNFETDVAGWSAYTGVATPTRVTTTPFSGVGRLQAVGNSTSTSPRVNTNALGLVVGDTWTFSGRVRMDGTFPTGATPYVAIRWQVNPSGEQVVGLTPTWTPDGAGWQRISVTSTVPAATNGTAVLSIGFTNLASNLTAAGSIGLDEVLWEKTGTMRNYFDGSTSGASWTGTANASTSTWVQPAALSSLSMVSGPTKSLVVGDDYTISYPFPERFSKEYTKYPFSLETWVGFDSTGPVSIMSHTGTVDGLYFDGDYINFTVNLDIGSPVVARWATPDFTKNYFVAGVYNGKKISLYIDGVLRDEQPVPDGSVLALQANKNIISGVTASQAMRIEAPAIYYKELGADRILAHYKAGRALMGAQAAVSMYSGAMWKFSDERADILYAKNVDFTSDGLGLTVTPGTYLEPMYDPSDLSVAGTYTLAVPFADAVAGSPPAVQGMKLEWSGDGTYTVQYSLNNGGSWTTAVNGQIQASTVGMAGTVVPQIRITFPSGAVKGANVVRSMRVTAYKTIKAYPSNSNERSADLNSLATPSTTWSEPIEVDNASGVNVTSVNNITINNSLETDFTSVAAIEFWAEWSTTTTLNGSYLIDSRAMTPSDASYIWISGSGLFSYAGFSALYVNGALVGNNAFTPVAGQSYHIVGVYTTPHNAKIRIGPAVSNVSFQLDQFSTYPTSLTAAQILALFNSYFNYPVLAAEDANTINVLETAPASKAYVADWSIQGAG